jgi:hypothetical protein
MHCASCGAANDDRHMFCLRCGGRLRREPPAEPGGGAGAVQPAWPGAAPPQGSPCGRCGSGRSVPASFGPPMTVRVQTAVGGTVDLPMAMASVCVDCGNVALSLAQDARQYLASVAGR